MDVRVVDDPAAECATLLCEAAAAGQHMVITGGSTPGNAYRCAAAMGADWSGAHVWFSDERCVPPDDEQSNYRLVKETLLDPLGDTGPEVHRIKGELGPDAGADDYEEERRGAPRIDL